MTRSWILTSERRVAIAAAACLLGVASTGRAEPNDAAERAEALFQSARERMEAGDYASACPTFAESYRLHPGTGTLLALALCHEHQGLTATAWREFTEVAAASERDQRRDRVELARRHIDALAPRLSRLTIVVSPELDATPGLALTLDAEPVSRASHNVAVPLDPGSHTVSVSAPGRVRRRYGVKLGASGDSQRLELAPLELERKPRGPATPQKQPQADSGTGQRTLGYVIGSAGIVALGVGSYFGVRALSKRSDAEELCPSSPCADQRGVDLNDEAKSAATFSTIGIGVGLLGLGVGAYLVLSASSGGRDSEVGALSVGVVRGGGRASVRVPF